MRWSRLASPAIVTASIAFAPATYAQDAQSADLLFEEGTKLFESGKYKEACEKLEASQKLDPAVGTQFNLAECWQKLGLLAKARDLYVDVVRIAHAAGKAETEKRATDRLAALEAQMPRVKIATASPPPETVIVDGVPRKLEDLANGLWLDPGRHELEAKSPGKVAFKMTFNVVETDRSTVDVPVLQSEVAPALAPSNGEEKKEGDGQRTIAAVLFGVGAVGIAVGTIFGALSLGKNGEASDLCPKPKACDDNDGFEAWKDARVLGNVSTVAFIVGGVAAAGGAALWFTAPSKSSTNVGVKNGGLVMRYTW